MTKPLTSKHQRLLAIERELRLMRHELNEALKLRGMNALMAATNVRLIAENDRLREQLNRLTVRVKVAA